MAVPPPASMLRFVLLSTLPPSMRDRAAFAVGATADVADANRVAAVATRVDLADDDDAAVGAGVGAPAVPGGGRITTSAVQRRDAASGQTHAMPVVLVVAARCSVAVVLPRRCRCCCSLRSFFRSSFLTDLRSARCCSTTLTSPSPSRSAFCSNSSILALSSLLVSWSEASSLSSDDESLASASSASAPSLVEVASSTSDAACVVEAVPLPPLPAPLSDVLSTGWIGASSVSVLSALPVASLVPPLSPPAPPSSLALLSVFSPPSRPSLPPPPPDSVAESPSEPPPSISVWTSSEPSLLSASALRPAPLRPTPLEAPG